MIVSASVNNEEDDDGLPDEAFTELELAAGVQHVMRTGDPNATSSGRMPTHWSRNAAFDLNEFDHERRDVETEHSSATIRFDTFAQAQAWAQANPGSVFTRAADGCGFEAKPTPNNQRVNSTQLKIDSYLDRIRKIKALAPYLHNVLTKSASNSRRIVIQPFNRTTWHDELHRLNIAELKRLRLLLTIHLETSRKDLSVLYAEMRRFPRTMKPGHYGEELSEKLHEIMDEVLAYIDLRLRR